MTDTTNPDFRAALAEQRREEGTVPAVTFTVGTETFECGPAKLPGWTVLELQAADETDVTAAAQAIIGFFKVVVAPADWSRFLKTVRSTAEPVADEELMGTIGDIIEAYAARPTRRPSASPDGPSSTGPSSTTTSSLPRASAGAVPFSRAKAG